MNLSKRIIIYVSIVAVVSVILLVGRQPVINMVSFVKSYSNSHDTILSELRQEIFAPPLRSSFSGAKASLSSSNIIGLTNQERISAGANPLQENSLLDQAAMLKVQDMFNLQYFEHISPSGNGPGYLADKVNYNYVVVGENLALGTFKDDASLIKAWMDSPGHRENILNTRYQNIGVAVGEGMFNGERVSIAVQEFGKPASACPSATVTERLQVDDDRVIVEGLNSSIVSYKKTLDDMSHTTAEEDSVYNAKIAEYNNIVSKYNAAVSNLKAEIDAYNSRVREFNACAAE